MRIKLNVMLIIGTIASSLVMSNTYADSVGFSDVESSNLYSEYILDLQSRAITQGVGEDRFAPEEPITRAEFVTLMVRTYHLPLDNAQTHFSDMEGHWAESYVQAAWETGMIDGTSPDTFDPDTPIRREDAATIVWTYLKSQGVSPSVQNFMLPRTVDSWASSGVAQCVAKKLFGPPFKSGNFQDAMNREEAAALIDISLKQL